MKKVQDHYFKKAKIEGYVARSAYKLEEIDQKQGLLHAGDSILDLGCFPGSWLQYTAKKIGVKGSILGIDIQPLQLDLQPNIFFLQQDILDLDLESLSPYKPPFDVVLSDMAPKTTGNKHTDGARVLGLNQMALLTASRWLKTGGSCLIKVFHGPAFEPLLKQVKSEYNKVKTLKPKCSRKESKEIFILGQEKKTVHTHLANKINDNHIISPA